MSVPSTDIFDGFDGGEFAIVDVDVVSNTHKWFMDISNREHFYSGITKTGLIDLTNFLIKLGNFRIKEDYSYDLKRDKC